LATACGKKAIDKLAELTLTNAAAVFVVVVLLFHRLIELARILF